ncbi:phosphatase 2C-like domain-containing protein [Auriculariales sp. MPI-PUGE-AT-0066]|nr:phosphatase 2C-like domain-containing protein [Auriculariales sp. MPI-PUGE-AT-0066]
MHRLAVQRAFASRVGHIRTAAHLQSALLGSRLRIGTSVYVVATRGMGTKREKITPPTTIEEAEKKLYENETVSELIKLGPGINLQHHINTVASHSLNEDRIAHSILNDRIYYACIDGHGGAGVSIVLSDTLIPRVDEALQKLGPEKIKDDKEVKGAIQEAFHSLDCDIVLEPLMILQRGMQNLNRTPKEAKEIDMAFKLAMMGGCVVLAILDPHHNRLHIATTGNSRATMGTWNSESRLWDVSQLSEDQTSLNPKEAMRYAVSLLYPPAQCLISYRILFANRPLEMLEIPENALTPGLGPSRAFGDAMFKWPWDLLHGVSIIYPIPHKLIPEARTSLYLTARPEVSSREIVPKDALEQGMRRFVVLGTDELYRCFSNAEIVGLVGGSLQTERPKHDMTREAVEAKTQLAAHPEGTYFADPGYGGKFRFIFKDQNLATHLIRNSIAGSHFILLNYVLGLPKKLSRQYRGHTSVIVIDIQATSQYGKPLAEEPDTPSDLRSKFEAAAA